MGPFYPTCHPPASKERERTREACSDQTEKTTAKQIKSNPTQQLRMADATGSGGGPRMSASPPPSPSTTSSSLDGGFLLRLLQNPPQTQIQTPTPPTAPGPHFFDPAVAAVGPISPPFSDHHLPHHHLFPSPSRFAVASPPQHGGFVWPSPSPPQQHGFPNYFLDGGGGIRHLAPPLDPYPALGRNFGPTDGIIANRPEKPKQKAPPPGFGKSPLASTREVFGKMPQRREQQQQQHQSHPLSKTPNAKPREMFGKMPQREEQQQQNHHLHKLPNANACEVFGKLPNANAREVFGKMPQREQQQQQQQNHHSHKLPNANAREVLGKMPLKDQQQQHGSSHRMKGPPGRWVAANERQEGRKNKEADMNDWYGLHGEKRDVGIAEGDLGDGVDRGMRMEVRKIERLYQKSQVRFAGHAGAEDECKEEDAISEQLMEALVLGGDGAAKNGAEQKGSSRSKEFRSDFFRGHNVSSQRIRIQRRNRGCRYDIDQFTPRFLSIFESLVPSEEEIAKQKQLLMSLSKLINKEWPDSKLYLYGSCANSFGFSNSDIDLCLSVDDSEKSKADIILKLADILQAGNLQNVQALTRARVPIVKLMDPDTGLCCDICVNNLLAVVNTKLLKDYAKIDKRLRQLAFIVKHWAKSRHVNETYQGTLSSYAYVIMCIHLLQLRSILPCLQAMEATYFVTVDDTECAYFDQVDMLNNYGARNEDSVARLLWAFFHYWAYQHDYTTDVVSIRTGRIISKQTKDWTRRVGNDRHLICIEDPFETSHDLGRVVDKFSIKILREEFERAANILQYDPNPCITLFDPYVPPRTPNLIQEDMVSNTETEL